ncbi:hypothetical protein [Planctobacterium marinum]|uniref:hypothetical protein n=1 Tax=Planctobacterium marinum TaxID=1631968 RepID=UPI001E445758|nr:hypothetical protein [Planctobacterium marinum]MCC2605827.1 hypothetical protein [Planctobacterium marinum]
MEFLYYGAAILLVAIAAAHSYLGERFILSRLFTRTNLPKLLGSDDFTKRTLRFAWHITSVAWLGFAAIIVCMSHPGAENLSVIHIIAATFAVHFLISLLGSGGKHLSWIVFGLISVLLWFAVLL